jgi:hypothetical protein
VRCKDRSPFEFITNSWMNTAVICMDKAVMPVRE